MSTDNTKKELTDQEIINEADKRSVPGMESFNNFVAGATWARDYCVQQTASMAEENKLYQEFKKLLGDIDPFEFIKVSKKHSAFELMLEHVLHTNKIQELSEELERVKAASKNTLQALEWAFDKTQVVNPNDQSDHFNLLTNAIEELKHLQQ